MEEFWGNYALHENSLKLIQELNISIFSQVPVNDEILFDFIQDAYENNSALTVDINCMQANFIKKALELNDYIREESFIDDSALKLKNHDYLTSEVKLYKCDGCNEVDKGKELYASIQQDPDNIQNILSIMNDLGEDSLSSALKFVWNEFTLHSERVQFIVAISHHISASILFCRQILGPWLQNSNLNVIVETMKHVTSWLGNQIIDEFVTVLLKGENDLLVQDLHLLKNIVLQLNAEQRRLLLKAFLDMIGMNLKNWQIPVLTTLLEHTFLSSSLLENTLNLLTNNVDYFNQDRYMGKLLLVFFKSVEKDTSQTTVNQIVLLIEKFKGLMRFKLKKMLKGNFKGT